MTMATPTVRNLDDAIKARLRARAILHGALPADEAAGGLGTRIHRRFAGRDLPPIPVPGRTEAPRAAEYPE